MHSSLWRALREQGVEEGYVQLLQSLYEGQVGHITGSGATSKPFQIARGTKQGDPMSPTLFNAVLQSVFARLQRVWRKRGWGIEVEGSKHKLLTCLCFAGDVLLLASSRHQLRTMLQELVAEAQACGLEIHTGKTKALSNSCRRGGKLQAGGNGR